jgi:hypothetical protein
MRATQNPMARMRKRTLNTPKMINTIVIISTVPIAVVEQDTNGISDNNNTRFMCVLF